MNKIIAFVLLFQLTGGPWALGQPSVGKLPAGFDVSKLKQKAPDTKTAATPAPSGDADKTAQVGPSAGGGISVPESVTSGCPFEKLSSASGKLEDTRTVLKNAIKSNLAECDGDNAGAAGDMKSALTDLQTALDNAAAEKTNDVATCDNYEANYQNQYVLSYKTLSEGKAAVGPDISKATCYSVAPKVDMGNMVAKTDEVAPVIKPEDKECLEKTLKSLISIKANACAGKKKIVTASSVISTKEIIEQATTKIKTALAKPGCTNSQVGISAAVAGLKAAGDLAGSFGGVYGLIAQAVIGLVGTIVGSFNGADLKKSLKQLNEDSDFPKIACLYYSSQSVHPDIGNCVDNASVGSREAQKATYASNKDLIEQTDLCLNEAKNGLDKTLSDLQNAAKAAQAKYAVTEKDKSKEAIGFYNAVKDLATKADFKTMKKNLINKAGKDGKSNTMFNDIVSLESALNALKSDKNGFLNAEEEKKVSEGSVDKSGKKTTSLVDAFAKLEKDFPTQKDATNGGYKGDPGWLTEYRKLTNPKNQDLQKIAELEQVKSDAETALKTNEANLIAMGFKDNKGELDLKKTVVDINYTGGETKHMLAGMQNLYKGAFNRALNKYVGQLKEEFKNNTSAEYTRGTIDNILGICMSTASMYQYNANKSKVKDNDLDPMENTCKKVLACYPGPQDKSGNYKGTLCSMIKSKEGYADFLMQGLGGVHGSTTGQVVYLPKGNRPPPDAKTFSNPSCSKDGKDRIQAILGI